MRSRICLAFLTSALLLNCIAEDNNPTFPYGTMQASCAPWDGAAITLTLSTTPLHCKRAAKGPFLNLGVWKDLPLHSGQVVKIAAGTSNGFASRCRKENDCEAVDSGEITFETFKESSGATGQYDLHFRNGDHLTGSFEVKWCDVRELCR